MLEALAWYLVVALLGLGSLPVVTLVGRRLPDRGFALARPVGLLLVAYTLWLLATFGVAQNGRAAAAGVAVVVALASWVGLRRHVSQVLPDLVERWRYVVIVEALFAAAFAAWCVVRSTMPDITATEKPMELAFLNASFRNPTYPPMDPWLSGYSISYYYFGYVMTALLCQLAGVATSVGFNLMIATLFALTVTGAFSVGYNMVGARAGVVAGSLRELPGVLTGLLASTFTVLLSNLEGALEILHAHGLGSPEFWAFIGIKDLNRPYVSGLWRPTEPPDIWWWFRASRVVATYGSDGNARDYTINEFPFFSFLLADLHPHVLALPFAFVALSLALCASLGGLTASPRTARRQNVASDGIVRVARSAGGGLRYLAELPYNWVRAEPVSALSVGLVVGALGFLNAWDLPTYLFVIAVGFAVGHTGSAVGGIRELAGHAVRAGWSGAVLAVALYLPFYIGFRSQTSGIGVVGLRSQLHHFLIFWGPMLFFAVTGLVLLWRRTIARAGPRPRGWSRAWWVVLAVSFALLALRVAPVPAAVDVGLSSDVVRLLQLKTPEGRAVIQIPIQAPVVALLLPLLMMSAEALATMLQRQPARMPVLAGAALRPDSETHPQQAPAITSELGVGATFALVLTGTGLLLLFGTELVFIRDLFNNRMNTVFKLYYQAWVLLALGSAYAVYFVANRWLSGAWGGIAWLGRATWLTVAVSLVVAATVYVPASLESRAGTFGGPPTLDGTAYMRRSAPGDYEAIRWLWQTAPGRPVIVEATGGSYSQFARVSTHTGLPTILGWAFHEAQWRGSYDGQDKRRADIETIYKSGNQGVVLDLLRAYDVTYVYVGSLEIETYGRPSRAGIDALSAFLDTVYRAGGVTIYKVRR